MLLHLQRFNGSVIMIFFFVFIVNMLCIIKGSIKSAELCKVLPWVGDFIQNMPQRENEVLEARRHQEDVTPL